MVMISRVTVAPGRKFVSDNDATNKKRLLSKQFKNKKTGVKQHMHSDARAFAIEFGTSRWLPGEGRPFLRPALENNSQLVTDSLGTELGKALIKYRSKTMKV